MLVSVEWKRWDGTNPCINMEDTQNLYRYGIHTLRILYTYACIQQLKYVVTKSLIGWTEI